MARKHHKPEEIVSKLRQVDVLVGQGTARVDAIRQVSIAEQTYYRLLSAFAAQLPAGQRAQTIRRHGDRSAQRVEEGSKRE